MNEPYTIHISNNLTTTGAVPHTAIVIPPDRNIILESSIATETRNFGYANQWSGAFYSKWSGMFAGANARFIMYGGRISGNTATDPVMAGGGGGIFLTGAVESSALKRVKSTTTLQPTAAVLANACKLLLDNTAFVDAIAPKMNSTIATRIQATSSSVNGVNHPLNNHDINFRIF